MIHVNDIIMFKSVGKVQAWNSPINPFPNNEKMRKAFALAASIDQFLVRWPNSDA